jgi:protein ImuA
MFGLSPRKAIIQPNAAILAHLREKLNHLEGMQRRSAHTTSVCNVVDEALPYSGLPLGCIHEVRGTSLASAVAFASLLSNQISQAGPVLYIAPDRSFYPLGLLPFGINFENWIHVSARRSRDLAWAALEGVRCSQVKVVLAVMTSADLTFCRRLQLAAESSGATGFLIHHAAVASSVASVITRWQVSSIKGLVGKGPAGRGIGEAFWKLELLYCRGGRPGKWMLAWRNNTLEPVGGLIEVPARPVQHVMLAQETALAG